MADQLKEKYNIFKGLVGLFETKLSSAVIVTLIIMNIYQFIGRQNSDARLYGMVIEEVRKQVPKAVNTAVAPIIAKSDNDSVVTRATADKIDELIDSVGTTLKTVNKNFK